MPDNITAASCVKDFLSQFLIDYNPEKACEYTTDVIRLGYIAGVEKELDKKGLCDYLRKIIEGGNGRNFRAYHPVIQQPFLIDDGSEKCILATAVDLENKESAVQKRTVTFTTVCEKQSQGWKISKCVMSENISEFILYENIVQSSPNAAFVLDVKEKVILFASQSFMDMFELDRNICAEGKHLADIFYEKALDKYAAHFEDSFNLTENEFSISYKGKTLRVNTKAIEWLGEKSVFFYITDDSANKVIQTQLIDSKLMIDNLLNNIPGGVAIYRCKPDKIETLYSSDGIPKLSGRTMEEYIKWVEGGDIFKQTVYEQDLVRVAFEVKNNISKLEPINIRYRLKHKDGGFVWVALSAIHVRDEDGAPVYYGVYSDITSIIEREENENDLRRAEDASRAKTEFISRLSHDMRTPLNAILGMCELILDKVTDKSIIDDLNQMTVSGKYLLELINDTLDVSKIESGKFELHKTVCDGRHVFNELLELIRPTIEQKNIHFTLDCAPLPFDMIYIDQGRLQRVFMNIIGNAVKFTPPGGEIVCKIENISSKNGIITDRFTVSDTGCGMSKSFLPHLFEPFTQENSNNVSSYNGTGLGMTITKQIIENMGGKIEVESEVGKGTTFIFTLDFETATVKQVEAYRQKQAATTTAGNLFGKRVLLCEDHPLNVVITTKLLDRKGVITECAENGALGLDMFNRSPVGYYDAILMDIRMPVMNGIEATKKIRALDRNDAKTIPIIALTANAFSDDKEESIASGLTEHLSKPINSEDLYSALIRLTARPDYTVKPKILIVDDYTVNIEVIKASLGEEFVTLEAHNGEEALQLLKVHPDVDAIITDIQMPVMDGKELIKRIRKDYPNRRIAILANTQYGEPLQEEELLRLGADDFIYKPTTSQIIIRRLHSVLK